MASNQTLRGLSNPNDDVRLSGSGKAGCGCLDPDDRTQFAIGDDSGFELCGHPWDPAGADPAQELENPDRAVKNEVGELAEPEDGPREPDAISDLARELTGCHEDLARHVGQPTKIEGGRDEDRVHIEVLKKALLPIIRKLSDLVIVAAAVSQELFQAVLEAL